MGVFTRVVSRLPLWLRKPLRPVRDSVYSVLDLGSQRWCPVCGKSSRRFRPNKFGGSGGARCIHCGALERHRFVWLFFVRKTDLFDGRRKRVLHVAPEKCFEARLRDRLGDGYLTADLLDPRAMVRMDIIDIRYPDESFDVIYCSHVLEHVPDDRRAMREFCRVLKKGGWAVVLVPIRVPQTIEDPSVVDPSERRRLFGQEDHVRKYGPDFADRLRGAGFDVARINVFELLDQNEIERMELAQAGDVYYCTKA